MADIAKSGLYHVWRAKSAANTREFLVANKRVGLTPLVFSMTATNLTPAVMLGAPMEAYSNGAQMFLSRIGWITGKLCAAYAILPVLYKLNVPTYNQYVEYRFNRLLRTVPAILGVLQMSLFISAITYMTAMVLTKATGLHVWWSILLVTGICIVYSSLGGVAAVIWTDVLQIVIVLITLAVMVVNGLAVTGGVANMWETNARGHRTTWAYFKSDPHSYYTVWSLVIGNFFMCLGQSATSQSELQRQLANRTLSGARKMSMWSIMAMSVAIWQAVFLGMLIYAQKSDCDPLLNGEVISRDMLAAKFAGEMFANSPGLFGLFVAAILCSTVRYFPNIMSTLFKSTLSSVINGFATVALIDFIKPLMPNTSDATSTLISKSVGILYGLLVISLTGFSQNLGGLAQTTQAAAGTSLGSTGGIVLLGMFFPWATAKGATVGYVGGLCIGWWLVLGRISVKAPYTTAPMSILGCNSTQTNFANFTEMATESAKQIREEHEPFFLYLVSPIWYCLITLATVIVVGLIASFATGSEDLRKLDPKLISPLTKWIATLLPEGLQKKSGFIMLLEVRNADGTEMQTGLGIDDGNKRRAATGSHSNLKSHERERQSLAQPLDLDQQH